MSDTALNFGPEWMRALSHGGRGGGGGMGGGAIGMGGNPIPGHPTSLSKNKPADYLYTREKMLELFTPMTWPPETLPNDPAAISDDPECSKPLAFTSLTQEEQRMWSRNINSEIAVRMMSGTSTGPVNIGGRGGMVGGGGGLSHSASTSSLMTRGRGGSMDRGRGRGRGIYQNYARGMSHDEEMEPGRVREVVPPGMNLRRGGIGYERSSSLSAGIGGGAMGAWGTPPNISSDHNPPSGGGVYLQGGLDHSTSRTTSQEDRGGASSPRKEQGRASTENWRNRDGSVNNGSGGGGEMTQQEHWRAGAGGGGSGGGLVTSLSTSRIGQDKWGNNRGLNGNGWRPRDALDEGVVYGGTNNYYSNSRGGRGSSNLQQQRSRVPWDGTGSRRNWTGMEEDRLPEWATDLSQERAGSFDSTGAYQPPSYSWGANGGAGMVGGGERDMEEGVGGFLSSTRSNINNSKLQPPSMNGNEDSGVSSISINKTEDGGCIDVTANLSSMADLEQPNNSCYGGINGHDGDNRKPMSHSGDNPDESSSNKPQPVPIMNGYNSNGGREVPNSMNNNMAGGDVNNQLHEGSSPPLVNNTQGNVPTTSVANNNIGHLQQQGVNRGKNSKDVSAAMNTLHINNHGQQQHKQQRHSYQKIDAIREEENLELLIGADDFVSKLVDEEPNLANDVDNTVVHQPHDALKQQQQIPPPTGFIQQGAGVVEECTHKWFYTDPQQEVQGPFSSHHMISWYTSGYFPDNLLIRRDCDDKFAMLSDLKLFFGRVPFFPGTPVPPLKELQETAERQQQKQQAAVELDKYDTAMRSYTVQKQLYDQQMVMRQHQILQQLRQLDNWNTLPEASQKHLFVQQLMSLQQQQPLSEPIPPSRPQTLLLNNVSSSTTHISSSQSSVTPPPQAPSTSLQSQQNFPKNRIAGMHQQQQGVLHVQGGNVTPALQIPEPVSSGVNVPVASAINTQLPKRLKQAPVSSAMHLSGPASSGMQMGDNAPTSQHQQSIVPPNHHHQQQQQHLARDPIRDLMQQLNSSNTPTGHTITPPPLGVDHSTAADPVDEQTLEESCLPGVNPLQKLLLQFQMNNGGNNSASPSPPTQQQIQQQQHQLLLQQQLNESPPDSNAAQESSKQQGDVLQSFMQQLTKMQQQKEKTASGEEEKKQEMEKRRQKEELKRKQEDQHKREEEQRRKQAEVKKREEEKKLKQKQKQEEAARKQEENKRRQEEKKREQEAAEEKRKASLEEERRRMHRIEQEEKQAMAIQHQQAEAARALQQQKVWSDKSNTSNTPSLLEIQRGQQEKERMEREKWMKEEEMRKQEALKDAAERKKNSPIASMTLKWAANQSSGHQSHGNHSVKSLLQIQQEEEKENKKRQSREAMEKSTSSSSINTMGGGSQRSWSGASQQPMSWANRASSSAAPPPPSSANTQSAKVWSDTHAWSSQAAGGFWESNSTESNAKNLNSSKSAVNLRVTLTKQSNSTANKKQQPPANNKQTNNKQLTNNNKKKKDEDNNKNNSTTTTTTTPTTTSTTPLSSSSPSDEFNKWCRDSLVSLKVNPESIDVPTFVGFLREVESPYEVHDYIRSYLGDTREVKDFAKNYLERRSQVLNATKRKNMTHRDDILAPAPAINPSSEGFQETKSRKQKGKKKMQKVDSSILGFNVNCKINGEDSSH